MLLSIDICDFKTIVFSLGEAQRAHLEITVEALVMVLL